MPFDLAGLIAHPQVSWSPSTIKWMLWQILVGLESLHSHGIIHRDIKGSNLLVDRDGSLRLADFGLARLHRRRCSRRDGKDNGTNISSSSSAAASASNSSTLSPPLTRCFTNRVITLWYRSHELLCGETDYGYEVDVWSVGCIFLEMIQGRLIFSAADEISHLEQVYTLLGTPDFRDVQLQGYLNSLPWYSLVCPKEAKAGSIDELQK